LFKTGRRCLSHEYRFEIKPKTGRHSSKHGNTAKEQAMVDKKSKKKSQVASSRGTQLTPSRIDLPRPALDRAASIEKAFRLRKTVREMSNKKLSLQVLSNLLWAAYGVNRKKGPFGIQGRTAASASNSQEIELYVATEEGIYFYDAHSHGLVSVIPGDFRRLAINPGQLDFATGEPIHLIYVADIDKLSHTAGYREPGLQNPEVQKSYYFVDTGLVAGNVYLFAASCGLASWFHNCDKSGLARKLALNEDKRVLFAQTVGYPAKK
jgi:nitroreductase